MAKSDIYIRPKSRKHRSFVYLDDELVVNSLSALESGQIDTIVSKINAARDGGLSASISASVPGVKAGAEGSKRKQTSYEDELIRVRTKFSIFESWYQLLDTAEAIGELKQPSEWQKCKPEVGDLLKVTGQIKTAEIYPLMRMYSDYATAAKKPGHPWYEKGEKQREIAKSAEISQFIFGKEGEMLIPARVALSKESGSIAFTLAEKNLLGSAAPIEGEYTVIGQVTEILDEGDWSPTLRLMPRAPKSEFERTTITKMLEGFEGPSEKFGVTGVSTMGEFNGPALLLEPIAVYR